MAETRPTIFLVGGTSHVAGALIRELSHGNYRVLVVTRRPRIAEILLGDLQCNAEVVSMEQAAKVAPSDASTVVNFAYVKSAPKHKVYPATRRLMESVKRLAVDVRATRLIHTSTIAVFGYEFSETPRPIAVPWRPGDGYTDLKIYAEHALARSAATNANYSLAIVRLGNVIGPGANPWTAGIAQSMLEGKPVGRVGRIGFSNATYTKNIASYIRSLIDAPAHSLQEFGTYHHLAEFSNHSWNEIFDKMGSAIGSYTLVNTTDHDGSSGEHWLPNAKESAKEIVRRVYRSPVGNRVRAAFSFTDRLPFLDHLVGRIKEPAGLEPPAVSAGEQQQFAVVGNPVEFKSHTLRRWTPPASFDEAMDDICRWAASANYSAPMPTNEPAKS
jgi:nucleoside-diphosphate-sugar epimerase